MSLTQYCLFINNHVGKAAGRMFNPPPHCEILRTPMHSEDVNPHRKCNCQVSAFERYSLIRKIRDRSTWNATNFQSLSLLDSSVYRESYSCQVTRYINFWKVVFEIFCGQIYRQTQTRRDRQTFDLDLRTPVTAPKQYGNNKAYNNNTLGSTEHALLFWYKCTSTTLKITRSPLLACIVHTQKQAITAAILILLKFTVCRYMDINNDSLRYFDWSVNLVSQCQWCVAVQTIDSERETA